jgi:UDP-N-acetylmuramate--alanine ligase
MKKIESIQDFNSVFFIGIAGTGMSAIAQYLSGIGKTVSGSDRFFKPNEIINIQEKLEKENINCFVQDGFGINEKIDLIVVSTAIEDTVPEVQKAKQLGIPILKRSQVLALIVKTKKQFQSVVLLVKALPVL